MTNITLNAGIDTLTGTGTRNLNFVDRYEEEGAVTLQEQLLKIREDRSPIEVLANRKEEAIKALTDYIKEQNGINDAEARKKAIDHYNYILDLPSPLTANAIARKHPDVLNIGSGALIKSYQAVDMRSPVLTRKKTIAELNDSYQTDDTDYSRSTWKALYDPKGEAARRALVLTGEELGETPEDIKEELTNTTADWLRTGKAQSSFGLLSEFYNTEQRNPDGTITFASTIFAPETEISKSEARKEIYQNVARNLGLSDRISFVGENIVVSTLSSEAVSKTGPNPFIIEADLGQALTVIDLMINDLSDRNNGVLPQRISNQIILRSEQLGPRFNKIREVYSSTATGSVGAQARQIATTYLGFLRIGNAAEAEKSRQELDNLLKEQLIGFGEKALPDLIKTTPETALMIKEGRLPSSYIKNVALYTLGQEVEGLSFDVGARKTGDGTGPVTEDGTGPVTEDGAGPVTGDGTGTEPITPPSMISSKELIKMINNTGGDLGELFQLDLNTVGRDDGTIGLAITNAMITSANRVVEIEDNRNNVLVGSRATPSGISEIVPSIIRAGTGEGYFSSSSKEKRNASVKLQTIGNNLRVAINQNNRDKALKYVALAEDLVATYPDLGLEDSDVYRSIQEYAEKISPIEIAKQKRGGLMIPRLNEGGIEEIVVTGTRPKPKAGDEWYDPRYGLVRGGSRGIFGPQTVGAFPSETIDDIRAEQDMEKRIGDVEGDESINYDLAQIMGDQAKVDIQTTAAEKLQFLYNKMDEAITDEVRSILDDPLKTAKEKGDAFESALRANLKAADIFDLLPIDETPTYGEQIGKYGFKDTFLTTEGESKDPIDIFVKNLFGFGKKKNKEKTNE